MGRGNEFARVQGTPQGGRGSGGLVPFAQTSPVPSGGTGTEGARQLTPVPVAAPAPAPVLASSTAVQQQIDELLAQQEAIQARITAANAPPVTLTPVVPIAPPVAEGPGTLVTAPSPDVGVIPDIASEVLNVGAGVGTGTSTGVSGGGGLLDAPADTLASQPRGVLSAERLGQSTVGLDNTIADVFARRSTTQNKNRALGNKGQF